MNLRKLEDKYAILIKLGEDVSSGKFKNLFDYLQIGKNQELSVAQDLARSCNKEGTVFAVIATALYDEMLSWRDSDGLDMCRSYQMHRHYPPHPYRCRSTHHAEPHDLRATR